MYYSFIFIPLFISYICIHRKFTGTTKKYIHEHFDKWNMCTVLYMVPPNKTDCTKYICIEKKCLSVCLLYEMSWKFIPCAKMFFWDLHSILSMLKVCIFLNSDYRLKWTSPGAISTMNFYPHPLPTPSSSESWKPGWSVTPSMCTGRVWTLCLLPSLLLTSTMRVRQFT